MDKNPILLPFPDIPDQQTLQSTVHIDKPPQLVEYGVVEGEGQEDLLEDSLALLSDGHEDGGVDLGEGDGGLGVEVVVED